MLPVFADLSKCRVFGAGCVATVLLFCHFGGRGHRHATTYCRGQWVLISEAAVVSLTGTVLLTAFRSIFFHAEGVTLLLDGRRDNHQDHPFRSLWSQSTLTVSCAFFSAAICKGV